MKTLGIVILVLLLTAAFYLILAPKKEKEEDCEEEEDDRDVYVARLNGLNEVPPNKSIAAADAILSLNPLTRIFTLTVNYSDLTPIAAHIHKGEIGISGPIVFALDATTNPITYISDILTLSQIEDLKNGLYYVNIHTLEFPGGEIRGQLMD